MRATDFEFRHRFWLFGLIFWVGFSCYTFDHMNAGVALLSAVSGPGSDLDSSRARHELQAIFGVATLLMVAAAMMRTWATAYLQTDVVQDSSVRTDALVADGPYRYLRNPLYFGNLLMTVAMAALASRTGALVMVLAMLVFEFRLIGREEYELLETQGDRYRSYRNAVPRIWPSLRPRLPSGGMKPHWRQAWLGEAFFWGFAAAVASFAATLKPNYFYVVTGLSVLFAALILPLWKRKGTRSS